jgi:hypothetical protein
MAFISRKLPDLHTNLKIIYQGVPGILTFIDKNIEPLTF